MHPKWRLVRANNISARFSPPNAERWLLTTHRNVRSPPPPELVRQTESDMSGKLRQHMLRRCSPTLKR